MSHIEKASPSPSGNPLTSKSNGESEVETTSDPPKFFVEDFSALAITRGQVEINFLLTAVNEKTRVALEQLEAAVQEIATKAKVDIDVQALKAAIDAVHAANQKVAGPFPPGCDPKLVDRLPDS
jgi:hypothetical protein